MGATATLNTAPNVICRRMQVAVLGRPMKSKEQRKQEEEMSRTWLGAQLFALTMGVSQCFTKTHKTTAVMADKQRAVQARDTPKGSSKPRKLKSLGRQRFLSLFGCS